MQSPLILPLFLGATSGLDAAGLDCKRSRLTPTEQMICADPQVLKWDKIMSTEYDRLIDVSTETEKALLRGGQHWWLAAIRDECETLFCLGEAYSRRIAYLQDAYPLRLAANLSDGVLSRMPAAGLSGSPAEIRESLADCNKNNTSMKVCSAVFSILQDFKLQSLLSEKDSVLRPCQRELQQRVESWKRRRQKTCEKYASDEVGGWGATWGIYYNMCKDGADRTLR